MSLFNRSRIVSYDVPVPAFVIKDLSTIKPGDWTIEDIENIIGQPGQYETRTIRVFMILPETDFDTVDVHDLGAVLEPYALTHNLSARITYYPEWVGHKAQKKRINPDATGNRITIDVMSRGILNRIQNPGSGGFGTLSRLDTYAVTRAILGEMHVQNHRMAEILQGDPYALERLDEVYADEKASALGTEYDYNCLRVYPEGGQSYTDVPVRVYIVR